MCSTYMRYSASGWAKDCYKVYQSEITFWPHKIVYFILFYKRNYLKWFSTLRLVIFRWNFSNMKPGRFFPPNIRKLFNLMEYFQRLMALSQNQLVMNQIVYRNDEAYLRSMKLSPVLTKWMIISCRWLAWMIKRTKLTK